jgi:predicted small metal-binding protein
VIRRSSDRDAGRKRRGDPMKDFHCRDVGLNCDVVLTGNTTDDVFKKAQHHVERTHAMRLTPEMGERVKWLIHDESSPGHRDSVQRNS